MAQEQEKSETATLVHRTLVGLVKTVCRYPWLTLATALVLVALSALFAYTRLTFLTQRNDLISPSKDYLQRWRQYLAEFGDDDDMVVVIKGTNRQQMQQALEEIAAELTTQPKLFDRVFYKVDLRSLHNRALLFLSVEQIRQIQENLQSMNLLFEPPLVGKLDPLFGWKSLNLSQLLSEAERRVFTYSPTQPLRNADKQFFLQLATINQTATNVLDNPEVYKSPWRSILPDSNDQQDLMAEPQYFFSGDGTLAFLLTRPAKDLHSFTSAQQSIDQLRKIVQKMDGKYQDLDIGLTGLPILENDEMIASQVDTTTASWLALAGVALLYLIVYRCFRYPFLTVSTLIVGTVWALGWLTLTVGHLNILSATFAVMLIGLGDYGVLWVTRFEQERTLGSDLVAAMEVTAFHIGPSILTASTTTALAFFSAILVDFRAVAELGWIAGSGVLLCALACFTVLPAMMVILDRKQTATKLTIPLVSRASWLPGLNRHPRWIVATTIILAVVGGLFAFRVRYDHNLLNLQANGLESVKWEMTLIKHTAGASWHSLSITTTPEEALALKARFEKLPEVSRVVEVASLVPREQELKLVLLRDIQNRLRGLPKRGTAIPHFLPDPELLSGKVSHLLDSLELLHSKDNAEVVAKLQRSLEGLKARLEKIKSGEIVSRLRLFEEWLTRDLAEDLHKLRDVSTPQPITTAHLPESLRERYVGKSGKWLLRVFGQDSLWEYKALEQFVEQIQEIDPDATGKPFSTLAGLRLMKDGFIWAAIYALIAMILVFLADFRNVWHCLLALSPLMLGVVLSLGVMGFFGLPLNPANMIALPLILGVGADNGVHIVHDYLSRRKKDKYRLGLATGRGIFVAALTTILGFGTLMISHHRGLYGLGLLLTVGISCCTLAALVLLPAILAMFTNRESKKESTVSISSKAKAA